MEPELESILVANWYFVSCKFDCSKSEESKKIARSYLTQKINKALTQRKKFQMGQSIKEMDRQ
jgi:hypothetical protein